MGTNVRNDPVKFTAHVYYRLSPPVEFLQKYPSSDGILLVENIRVHIVRSYLAMYSPFFSSLFGEIGNKSKLKVIPLENVKCNEFVELLRIIYPSRKRITSEIMCSDVKEQH